MARPATAAVRFLSGEREPVRVATTANIELDGLLTIDGVLLEVNDRVLVKDQTDARENGIYTASVGLWQRASDARFPRAISAGITVQVIEGTAHGGQVWRFATVEPRIGIDDIAINFYLSANFAADAQETVDTALQTIEDAATNTIGPLVQQAQDAAEAAIDIVSGVEISTFATKAVAETYAPAVAPTFLRTAFYDSDQVPGSGALYANNGTSAGDLVITLDDGVTEVGFDVAEAFPVVAQYGRIKEVDDRNTWQAAFSRVPDGGSLVMPDVGPAAQILNATYASGSNLVERRADAVTNGTLRPVRCEAKNATIEINCRVDMLSALANLFEITGEGTRIILNNTVKGPGDFLDTNPLGADVGPNQWYPSLVWAEGENQAIIARDLVDPPTIGAFVRGSYSEFDVRCSGGPTPKGAGTMLMAVYSGKPQGLTERINGKVKADQSSGGGAVYSAVFNTAANSQHDVFADGLHEHGWYNYGAFCTLNEPTIKNCPNTAVQSFAPGTWINGGTYTGCVGGVQLMNFSHSKLRGLHIDGQLYGVALRSIDGAVESDLLEDVLIEDVHAKISTAHTRQSPLDVSIIQRIHGLRIVRGEYSNGPIPGGQTNAGIRLWLVTPSGAISREVSIDGATVRDCDGYAVAGFRVNDFRFDNMKIRQVNGVSGNTAIGMFASTNGDVDDNKVFDYRGAKLTNRLLSATGADGNSSIRARNNSGHTLLSSSNPLVSLPTDSSSWGRGNNFDGLASLGEFAAPNATSFSVGLSGTVGSTIAEGIRSTAKVRIHPKNEAALAIQRSAKSLRVTSVGNGQFSCATGDGTATGTTSAEYWFEYDQ